MSPDHLRLSSIPDALHRSRPPRPSNPDPAPDPGRRHAGSRRLTECQRLPRPPRRLGRGGPGHLGLAGSGHPALRRHRPTGSTEPCRAALREGPGHRPARVRRTAHDRLPQPEGRRGQDHQRPGRGLHVRHRPRRRGGRLGQQRDPRHPRHPGDARATRATPRASCSRTSTASPTRSRGSATSRPSSAPRATRTSTSWPPTSAPTSPAPSARRTSWRCTGSWSGSTG